MNERPPIFHSMLGQPVYGVQVRDLKALRTKVERLQEPWLRDDIIADDGLEAYERMLALARSEYEEALRREAGIDPKP